MHRNTFLLVAGLAVLAALVLGINIGSRTAGTSPSPTPSETPSAGAPTPSVAVLQEYLNSDCGFSFRYPAIFTLENQEAGATLIDSNDEANVITVACQEDIPRIPLSEDKIDTLKFGTISAQLYHDVSAEDGTPIDKFFITHPTRAVDIYIAGYGQNYRDILKTLTLYP